MLSFFNLKSGVVLLALSSFASLGFAATCEEMRYAPESKQCKQYLKALEENGHEPDQVYSDPKSPPPDDGETPQYLCIDIVASTIGEKKACAWVTRKRCDNLTHSGGSLPLICDKLSY